MFSLLFLSKKNNLVNVHFTSLAARQFTYLLTDS